MLSTTLPVLQTQRLLLRPWRQSDLAPFSEINADPKVMEFYTHPLSLKESAALAEKIQKEYEERGYGFWAVEIPGVAEFIGYIGLNYWNKEHKLAPFIDIGWRLSSRFWGKGYATEGAREVLRYGFETLKLEEIFSLAQVDNARSRRVMEKLGMKTDPEDNFEHPTLPRGHYLSWHALYRLKRT